MPYPQIPANPDFPEIERGILAFWNRDDTFRASVDNRDGCEEWVFYDGPPFANGLPHYGHLLTGYAKDLFPRYQTMRGKQVHRRFGWDTHGLPAELEAERQLGITDKSQIEQMGIAAFNAAAKKSVLTYTKEWEEYVTRQARWVDFENDYKTLDVTFMESVVWAFSELYRKGLAYEGYRVLPYCWRDQTPLSNHELRMDDDVYKMRQDQSVTVTFPLVGEKAEALGLTGVQALAWTTTPWTLPTNAALAVGPEVPYAVVRSADGASEYLLATETIDAHKKELGYGPDDDAWGGIRTTLVGRELAGVQYDLLWDYFRDDYGPNGFTILVADYVGATDGTGIVHQAPAYGEDDQVTTGAAGIPVVLSVDDAGRFLPVVDSVAGLQVFEANPVLVKKLRDDGRLFQVRSYEHSYPHCWRCRNPLIYKAVSSWFVRVTDIKDRAGALNDDITWVPENVKDGQFGKWVANARDWSISRNRYWGSPIPVWKSDDPAFPRVDVYGSLAELEADFGRLPLNADGEVDLHRPYIDDLTRPNPDDPSGRATMRRIPDVLDVWFDSGSMPFAQVHYPFENASWFTSHNPADFIVEYIGQTRGWFYVMHVLSTALFDRPAFRNVISHGIVLGNDGQKMSKSLRNYPDVNEVFDRDGADAMRWFLMSSSVIRGGNLVVTEEGIRGGVRELLLPLWSTYYFFTLYANSARVEERLAEPDASRNRMGGSARVEERPAEPDASRNRMGGSARVEERLAEPDASRNTPTGYTATWRTDSTHVLDRYILAKTREVLETVTGHLDELDSPFAATALRDFGDVLTNWYVRRSRDRFWDGADQDAFDTLYTVLETLTRMAAPLLPLVTEEVWKGLTGGRSVHLTDWPSADEFPADRGLVETMDAVRAIASAGLALRKERKLRVRLPLPRLTIVSPHLGLADFAAILEDELNVKRVDVEPLTDASLAQHGIRTTLAVNARALGPRLGKEVQRVIQAAKAGDYDLGDRVVVGGVELFDGEFDLRQEAEDDASVAFLDSGAFIVLDTAVTPELEAEGLARDVIRAVQQARKDAGLEVSDRISLTIVGDPSAAAAVGIHRDLISGETLATALDVRTGENGVTAVGAGSAVTIELERA